MSKVVIPMNSHKPRNTDSHQKLNSQEAAFLRASEWSTADPVVSESWPPQLRKNKVLLS
jgi:hypothetical protein